MLFQIIENKVETSSFKYENAKRVLDIHLEKMMTRPKWQM